ncbi:hypothetical protein [Candidatus Pelagisphaera phototrophica]|uniref:hypothetical protein n=1 Tax=Candidatus Pelagisphaera phototrophica TaxID=2684113 RepID=UPI0019E52817|nr:hypothetical protein [Candidatus Pelagisphaera phototrophica]QXD32469.1 hypothetical protein GA004_01730 [Candidatus Pelagisphaera phototrophica]
MEAKLGEKVQIDYGTMVLSKARMIATGGANPFGLPLSFSRKSYIEAIFRQDTKSFVRRLENALR